MITEVILSFIKAHSIIVPFLGGFITGESLIITLGFLSANGAIPLEYVLIFCTLGMYLSDFIPFIFGRMKFIQNLFKKRVFLKKIIKIEETLKKYTHNNLFLILFITKIIYSASIPALVYLGHKKISYQKFAFYNLFVELIFVPLVVLIGWLSGKGFLISITVFNDVRIGLLVLAIIILILYIAKRWINQRLIKMQKQLK